MFHTTSRLLSKILRFKSSEEKNALPEMTSAVDKTSDNFFFQCKRTSRIVHLLANQTVQLQQTVSCEYIVRLQQTVRVIVRLELPIKLEEDVKVYKPIKTLEEIVKNANKGSNNIEDHTIKNGF